MKKLAIIILFLSLATGIHGQDNPVLVVEQYQLKNGLTVFLNPDSTATRVFGAVMVNAGAKHEDPNATGMAHYLEHLLFKGTDQFGTTDYEKEKVPLDSVNNLYEILAGTTDSEKKKQIQGLINEQAVQASAYGLPNEFDKMLKSIGSTGVNAFTNMEMTFYHNSFPSHEIEKWLILYAARFRNPVFRSFQSELEVVYEEKNRAMDNFERRIFEEAGKQMFPNLPYGQWSVLGTTEHLKTPSLMRMYEFYADNYVASNMSLILSGNFDPALVKPMIEREYQQFPDGEAKSVELPQLQAISGEKVVKKRMTPVKAGFIGFQTVGVNHPDRVALDVAEYLLSNSSETGLVNQLMNNGELIYSGGIPLNYNDAGAVVFFFVPKILVQSLSAAEKKLEAQFDKLKQGDFSQELFASAKNDLIREFSSSLENVTSRGIMIGRSFNQGQSWEEQLSYPQEIDAIQIEDIKRVAQKYFGEDRMKLVSKTGFPKKTTLDKPGFKPVDTQQSEESDFYNEWQQVEPQPFIPKFIDFQKDVETLTVNENNRLIYSRNPVNDYFQLTIRYQKGRLHDPKLITATDLMNVLGAGDKDLNQLKESFAALGISYYFQSFQNYVQVQLRGREENLEAGLELLSSLLTDPKISENTKKIYLNRIIADRKVEQENHNTMGRALYDYVAVGDASFYLNRMDEKELKSISVDELAKKTVELTTSTNAQLFYSGTLASSKVSQLLSKHLKPTSEKNAYSFIQPEPTAYVNNKIFIVDQKKAIQSQVYFHVVGDPFKPSDFADLKAFNGYFADGFSGLVTQEIREYRSLAYSTGANYAYPTLPQGKGQLIAYIGCQGDKTNDAIPVMIDLLQNMPERPERMEALRSALKLKTITNYPGFKETPFWVSNYQLNGFKEDPNKDAFEKYDALTMNDIVKFHQKNIGSKPYAITIYGDKSRIDLDKLSQYGEIIELEEKDFIKF